MIQYSCDRCGCSIDPNDDVRYVVRMEVEAVMSSPGDVSDRLDSEDHLMEIDEILELAEAAADPMVSDTIYRRQRFDLCSSCHRKFAANPLGHEENAAFDFSAN